MLKQQALYCLVKRETKSFALIKNMHIHSFIRGAFSTIEVCWWSHTSATRAKRTEYIEELCHFPETAHSANTGFFLVLFLSITPRPIFLSSLSLIHIGLCVLIFFAVHSIPFLSNLLHADYIVFSMSGFYFLYVFFSPSFYSHFCARWNN